MKPSKAVFFLIEFLNCYGVVYYSNFLFFYMKSVFGFSDLDNLLLAAMNGLIYIFAAWQCGAFAGRFGSMRSLYIGSFGIACSLIAGMFLHSAAGQVVVFAVWTIALCFIWPALEAIVVENSGANLAKVVGYYNVTWASGAAIAFFTAGMLIERLGMQSLFWLPLCLIPVQLLLLPVAARLTKKEKQDSSIAGALSGVEASPATYPARARHFLHMAWLANPLSYVAINTIIPLIPSISAKLGLSTGTAGIVCSLWMFMRLGVFVFLQRWTKWHYRWSGLAGAFVLMIVSFIGIILAPNLVTLIAVQIGFGVAIGLVYYSSLYYSLMVSDKKEANCGVHEAMVGLGQFVGPAFGAGSLVLLPGAVGGGVLPVGALLLTGFGGLVWMRVQFKKAD